MRVFVTGASGFVGSAVVADLLAHGHRVVGLARSEGAARTVSASGADVLAGGLDDLDALASGAAAADAVIHLAYHHVFSEYDVAAAIDRRAIETLGQALAGSGRALVVTAGIAGIAVGETLTEDRVAAPGLPRVSEQTAFAFSDRGVRVSAVRLPPTVHGDGDHGFVPALVAAARADGVATYPNEGTNRWPAVHRLDAAPLFRRAAEDAPAGTHLHAVAEQGVAVHDIADAIGQGLGVPVVSTTPERLTERSGFIGTVFGMDLPASSETTRQRFGWEPVQPDLLTDLKSGHYFG